MIDSLQLSLIMMNNGKYAASKISGREQVNSFSGILESQNAELVDETKIAETARTENVSLENMLKEKYPGIVYNVGDGTSSTWRTRNDYPFEVLFREGETSTEMIENWKPVGTNPKNQRYIPVAPGSKAVMIHPKAQERMENDPEFAKEVMERIESWFEYDIARNEAIEPGCTIGMSQAIAIGEDGEIANVVSIGSGDSISGNKQKNNGEEEYDWWIERMARNALYMQFLLQDSAGTNMSSFSLLGGSSFDSFGSLGFGSINSMLAIQSGQTAERKIHSMLQNGLKEKLGDTICGISTDEVINGTWADIEKGRSLRNMLMML